MDAISSRWRKPKGRPSKKRKTCAANLKKRWEKKAPDPMTANIPGHDSETDNIHAPVLSKPEASHVIIHKDMFTELLSQVPCKICTECSLSVDQLSSLGCSIKMELFCESCAASYGSASSSYLEDRNCFYDVSKLVSAFLAYGKDHDDYETLIAKHGQRDKKL